MLHHIHFLLWKVLSQILDRFDHAVSMNRLVRDLHLLAGLQFNLFSLSPYRQHLVIFLFVRLFHGFARFHHVGYPRYASSRHHNGFLRLKETTKIGENHAVPRTAMNCIQGIKLCRRGGRVILYQQHLQRVLLPSEALKKSR